MPRILACTLAIPVCLVVFCAGCASRPGWGFGRGYGQGTEEIQKSRAVIHDPYPLNDIGPEVVGGRPREYYNPQMEPTRNNATTPQLPRGFYPPPR